MQEIPERTRVAIDSLLDNLPPNVVTELVAFAERWYDSRERKRELGKLATALRESLVPIVLSAESPHALPSLSELDSLYPEADDKKAWTLVRICRHAAREIVRRFPADDREKAANDFFDIVQSHFKIEDPKPVNASGN